MTFYDRTAHATAQAMTAHAHTDPVGRIFLTHGFVIRPHRIDGDKIGLHWFKQINEKYSVKITDMEGCYAFLVPTIPGDHFRVELHSNGGLRMHSKGEPSTPEAALRYAMALIAYAFAGPMRNGNDSPGREFRRCVDLSQALVFGCYGDVTHDQVIARNNAYRMCDAPTIHFGTPSPSKKI